MNRDSVLCLATQTGYEAWHLCDDLGCTSKANEFTCSQGDRLCEWDKQWAPGIRDYGQGGAHRPSFPDSSCRTCRRHRVTNRVAL